MNRTTGSQSAIHTAVVVLALCASMNALGRGMGDSFMMFLLPLEQTFDWSRSSLTGVFSVYMLVSGLTAPIVGAALDRFGPRLVYGTGIASLAIGFWTASYLELIWQFYLVVGVLSGIGMATLGIVPTSVVLARWFRARLSTAMGIAHAGMGLGSLIMAPLVQILIDAYGWQGAYRALGLFMASVFIVLVIALPWRRISTGRSDWAVIIEKNDYKGALNAIRDASRDPAYWKFTQVFFFTALAVYIVNVQTVAFLVEYNFTPLTAATAYGAVAMFSVLGIVATGWAAERFGHARTALVSFFGSATGILALLAITTSPAAFLVPCYVLSFGISQGARAPIVSSLAARVFGGRSMGTIYGTIYALASVGGALGAWLSGFLYDLTGGYRASLVCALAALAIAAHPFFGHLKTLHSNRTH